MNILEQITDEVIEMQQYLHSHPELSRQENETCKFVGEKLTQYGIDYVEIADGGILGFIRGKKNGKTVLLRADMDALPVTESDVNPKGNKKICVSENEGVCHACGHDAHTSMLLSAAKLLQDMRESLCGTVVLMFERGEEKYANCIKIFHYIEENGIHIDSSFGIHVNPDIDSGKLAVNIGPVMASNVCFEIKIIGKGGHGAYPHLANNPIDCFVAIYNALNTVRMSKISPYNPLVFSIGLVTTDSAKNIIPNELYFGGSARFYHRDDGKAFRETLFSILDNVTKAYGCKYEIPLMHGPCMPVINDEECAKMLRNALINEFGESMVCNTEAKLLSETFGKATTKWPGVFANLGVKNDLLGTGGELHNSHFEIDPNSLKYGVAAYVTYATEFLKSDIDTSNRAYNGSFADMYREENVPKEYIDYLEGKLEDIDLF